ncbi:protein kinase family protein [Bremerella cremea]|uniref:protein kinase family protein n=1 Tax=Bremerella cremea TaxID=1031537 RepID=UPI0031F08E74
MFNQGDKPIPGYRLERFLGRGQFGEVWATEGPGGSLVALKFIALQQKTGIRELKSIQAVKRIKHANLCSVNAIWLLGHDGTVLDDYEIDLLIRNQSREAPNQTLMIQQTQVLHNPQYLVVSMTLADGSLEERRESYGTGGIPREELMDYMLQAARGIDYLNSPVHQVAGEVVGIQHRDIKPANLLYAGDSVLVGDFGVASAFGEYDTEATSVVGSLCYMAPESIKKTPSHNSDQYALAITYYQLRTASLPFEPTVSFAELVEIHVRGKLQFSLVTDVERAALARATSTDPKQRFRSCVEFVRALDGNAQQTAAVNPAAAGLPLGAIIGSTITTVVLIALLVWTMFGRGNAEGTTTPPTGTSLESHTLVFSPEHTQYEITVVPEAPRDDLISKGNAAATLELLPTDKLHIVATSKDPLYQSYDQEISFDDLVRNDWKLQLPPVSADEMLTKITKLAKADQWNDAAQLFAKAVAIHPDLQSDLSPESIELKGTPAAIGQSHAHQRLATAISGDASSSLGILPLDQPVEAAQEVAITAIPYQIHLPSKAPCAVLMQDSVASVVSLGPFDEPYEINLGTDQPTDIAYRQITSSALSPQAEAIVVGHDANKVSLLTIGSGNRPVQKSAEASFPSRVDAVAFDPAGKYCFAISQEGEGRRWPLTDFSDASANAFHVDGLDEEVLAIHPVSEYRFFAFTETRLLSITLQDDGKTAVEPIADMRAPLMVSRLTNDHKHLVFSTQSEAQPLSIVPANKQEAASGKPPTIRGMIEDFDISADSRWLIYVDSDGAIFGIDLHAQSHEPKMLLASQGERIKYVRLSSSGMDVVTLSEDGTTTWWNLAQLILAAGMIDGEPT